MINGSNKQGNGTGDLGHFLDSEIIPRLSVEAIFTHPAHAFQRSGDRLRGGCPWHDSKSGTAFYVDAPTLRWRCPACDIGGGPIQYLHKMRGGIGVSPRGREFVEIIRELAQQVGAPLPDRELSDEDRKVLRRREVRRAVLESAYSLCTRLLLGERGAAAREYLQQRGFDEAAIRELGLGLYPDNPEHLQKRLVSLEHDLGDVLTSKVICEKMAGFVVFPWRDEYGAALTLYGKCVGSTPPKGRPKTMALENPKDGNSTWEQTKRSPMYLDRALKGGHLDLVLVEGVTDAALPQSLGDSRVIACVGSQLSHAQTQTLARVRVQSVVIALDPDKAGDNGVLSCIRQLHEAGIAAYVAERLPDGMDPDEYIQAHGIEAWKAHVGRRTHGYRHMARVIIAQQGEREPGDDGWSDSIIDKAMQFASEVPQDRQEALTRHLLPEIAKATGANVEDLRRRLTADAEEEPAPSGATPAIESNGHAQSKRFECSDLGNGERFAKRHGAEVRYCQPWKKFMVWGGSCWIEDRTNKAYRLAFETSRSIWDEAKSCSSDKMRKKLEEHARYSASAKAIHAMLDLAKAQQPIPIVPEVMDSDPWLLNVPNGTLDLRTGQLREHRREDLITKLCPTPYLPEADCPTWKKTLAAIFADKAGLVGYFRRVCGYLLTAEVREQILLIAWGRGSNGKTTIINQLLETMGEDYAIKASRDLFMARKQDNHPAQLARLFGKRFVACVETQEGGRLDEALVKELTGSDPITARRMRENPWQFIPSHKCLLCSNHKPEIRGTDSGIWRRQRLIPFTQTFWDPERGESGPEHLRQDKTLPDKLRAERPGILRWMVEGCLEWQRDGMQTPKEVLEATETYRQEQDILGTFLEECCATDLQDPQFRVKASDIYAAYKRWFETNEGGSPPSQRRVGEMLVDKGFPRFTSNGTWYRGLHLRRDENPFEADAGTF